MPGRTSKQCRERYNNHLHIRIRKGEWTPEEDEIILKLHSNFGSQWSCIAELLHGRADNDVKNRFHVLRRMRDHYEQQKPNPANTSSSYLSLTIENMQTLQRQRERDNLAEYNPPKSNREDYYQTPRTSSSLTELIIDTRNPVEQELLDFLASGMKDETHNNKSK